MGLAVSIAGNVGHIQARPGHQVVLADQLTAATSPVAAFAGLTVGLLVLKMTPQRAYTRAPQPAIATPLVLASPPVGAGMASPPQSAGPGPGGHLRWAGETPRRRNGSRPGPGLLRDASAIYRDAAARGARLSQRALARQLRSHGHRFPNEHLRLIADSIGLSAGNAA